MSIIKDNGLVDIVVLDSNNIVCVLCTFYIDGIFYHFYLYDSLE